MLRRMIGNWAVLLALTATPAYAQEGPLSLPIEALLTLGERPDLDGAQFAQSLGSILPSTATDRTLTRNRTLAKLPFQDPYLWYFRRTLGHQSSNPDYYVECSRHGRATREWYAENRDSNLDSVFLEMSIPPLLNDQQPWPEGSVAQLHCDVFPGEVFSGVTEAEARAAFSQFQTISEPMEPEYQTFVYGPGGYHVSGRGGRSNSIMQVGSAQLVRVANSYVFSFTTFLIHAGS